MADQMTFKRYELKYLLTKRQKEQLLEVMKPYMELDQFGRTTIRNIYYDTDHYRLIRNSIEGPVYKEKLRVRSYRKAEPDSQVFVELKKKYNSVVYKRRLAMPDADAVKWLSGEARCRDTSQIAKEIDYFRTFYETLHPAVFLSYEREAYYTYCGDDFRVTFDENILFREDDLSLTSEVYGTPILSKDQTLMELKTSGGIPLWMSRFLTEQKIRKITFSKYGTAYQMMQKGQLYA